MQNSTAMMQKHCSVVIRRASALTLFRYFVFFADLLGLLLRLFTLLRPFASVLRLFKSIPKLIASIYMFSRQLWDFLRRYWNFWRLGSLIKQRWHECNQWSPLRSLNNSAAAFSSHYLNDKILRRIHCATYILFIVEKTSAIFHNKMVHLIAEESTESIKSNN